MTVGAATELLFRDAPYARDGEATVVAVHAGGLELDRTLFYPEGGGQPGDVGEFVLADGRSLAVTDTRKGEGGRVLHLVPALPADVAPGARVALRLDWARRHRLMRMHTCLHLLSAVVVAPVTGGAVGDGYGRLDFDLPDTPDAADVAVQLNALIAADHAVATRWITDQELADRPELVKTMSVKPPAGAGRVRLVDIPGVDLQPCGGTHVARTAEIGPVVVAKIEKKGRQNRCLRLEFAGGGA